MPGIESGGRRTEGKPFGADLWQRGRLWNEGWKYGTCYPQSCPYWIPGAEQWVQIGQQWGCNTGCRLPDGVGWGWMSCQDGQSVWIPWGPESRRHREAQCPSHWLRFGKIRNSQNVCCSFQFYIVRCNPAHARRVICPTGSLLGKFTILISYIGEKGP